MATSDVSVCNSALIKIGANRITSLSDGTKEAQVCSEQYSKLRDIVTAAHPWNFSIKRASLASLGTAPAFEFSQTFQLPSDCLRVLGVQEDDIIYRVEGKTLLTDESAVQIKYISQVVDPSLFTPHYAETLAFRLAAELAYALSANTSLAQTMLAAYQAQIKEARSLNGQEGTPYPVESDQWINSRW